jgi:hypothetical protein
MDVGTHSSGVAVKTPKTIENWELKTQRPTTQLRNQELRLLGKFAI